MKKQVLDYAVIIRPDRRTGTNRKCYSAYCPTLDIYSEGDTIEQALENIKNALQLNLEILAEDKQRLPLEPQHSILTTASIPIPANFQFAA